MIEFFLAAPKVKVLLIAAAAFLALSLGLGAAYAVQTFRLRAEQAEHRATRETLLRERTMTAIYKNSAESVSKSIGALQDQLAAMDASRAAEREQAARRERALRDAKSVPAKDAGVVDGETSRKAVEHINETIRHRP